MATKLKLMKMLQEMRGFSEISHRQPTPNSPILYTIQLRNHMYETSHPRRKLVISVDLNDQANSPHPVTITHIRPSLVEEGALSVQPA
jgi:hypothetical protein